MPNDVKAYKGPYEAVVACNDGAVWWPGELDVFASLHPEKMVNWLWEREKAKRPKPKKLVSCKRSPKGPKLDLITDFKFPGQRESGSSGLYIAKVALVDLGFDRVVLCGVPMERAPHVNGGPAWNRNEHYRARWSAVRRDYQDQMCSMSGWTREFLGGPEKWH